MVSKGSNSSEKPVLSRSPSAFKIGYNISRDVVTSYGPKIDDSNSAGNSAGQVA